MDILTSTYLESFLRGDYMPHGHCFLWQPGILWVTVLSDFLIGVSYFVISATLIIFIRKRKDLKFRAIFLLFGSLLQVGLGTTFAFLNSGSSSGSYGLFLVVYFWDDPIPISAPGVNDDGHLRLRSVPVFGY